MTSGIRAMSKQSLCKDFKRASWDTWHFIKRGLNIGILPGEETITDKLLIYLAHRHPQNMRIYRLSKHEESKLGADWEWWFHSPSTGAFLGMRVQAKKLNPRTLRYESLHDGLQLKKLIDHAKERSMVPVYVFYNYWCSYWCCEIVCDENTLSEEDKGVYGTLLTWNSNSTPGCTMADASNLFEDPAKEVPSGGVALWEIYYKMFCWEDIVCHYGKEKVGGIAERVDRALLSRGIVAEDSSKKHDDRAPNYRNTSGFLTTTPPGYVRKILEGRELGDEEARRIDAEYVWIIAEDGTEDNLLQSDDRACCPEPLFRKLL